MANRQMYLNTAIYSIGELFPKLISFFLLPVFTRYLSSADYGIISYTNSVMLFLLVLSSLSLNTFLLREYFDCADELQKKRLTGNMFYSILVFNIFILVVSSFLGPIIVQEAHLNIAFSPFFSLTLLNNFFEAFAIVPLVIFRVRGQAKYYVITNIVKSVLIFILTYVLIVNFHWGILGNYYGRLIINGIFVLIYLYIIYRNSVPNINLKQLKQALHFSLPLLPGAISYLLISMSDRVILERFVPLSQVGIYSVAYTLALSLTVVVQSGYRALEPEIYKGYKKPDFMLNLSSIHRIFMFAVFTSGTFLALFSREVLLMMTKGDFANGYIIIPLILTGIIVSAQNMILSSLAIAEKKPGIISRSTIIGGISSVTLNLILIPRFGIIAGAFTSALAFIIMNIIIHRTLAIKLNFSSSDVPALCLFLLVYVLIIVYPVSDKITFLDSALKFVVWIIFIILLSLIYKFDASILKKYIKAKL